MQPHAQSLFLFIIVFGSNLIHFNNFFRWEEQSHHLREFCIILSVSFYSDDGFQPMQKERYNNNDKKTE